MFKLYFECDPLKRENTSPGEDDARSQLLIRCFEIADPDVMEYLCFPFF